MNITDELDRNLPAGPAHRPVEEHIRAGRRIVVRRRLAVGAGVAAAALVVGGVGSALLPSGGTDAPPEQIPAAASGPGASTPEDAEKPADARGSTGTLGADEWGDEAAYRDAGGLQIKPGWGVTDRIQGPTGPGSLAIEVSKDGQAERRQWFQWDSKDGGGYNFAPNPAAVGDADTLAEWVASNNVGAGQPGNGGEGKR